MRACRMYGTFVMVAGVIMKIRVLFRLEPVFFALVLGRFSPALSQHIIDFSQQPADVTIMGRLDEQALGSSLFIGDLNGDGMNDLVVGAPGADGTNNPGPGEVFVFWGRSHWPSQIDLRADRADVTITGRHADDRFGQALLMTDVNGDGRDDLIIGAPGTNVGARTKTGAVYVLFGRTEWPGRLYMDSTRVDLLFLGQEPEEQLGNALAAGDLNADGRTDLILAAWMGSYPGMIANGKVYAFLQVDSLPGVISLLETAADVTIFGKNNNDLLGVSLAATDFNGDGYDDILIGDHKANTPTGLDAGVAYAIQGQSSMPDTLWLRQQAPSLLIMGASRFDYLGVAMITADLNDDGAQDWLIGAWQAHHIGSTEYNGGVFAFYGHDVFPDTIDLWRDAADVRFYGTDPLGFLGSALAAGDMTGDGRIDVALAAPRAEVDGQTDAGRVYILTTDRRWTAEWFVGPQVARLTLQTRSKSAFLGAALACGDINGDGFDDLIIGAPGESRCGVARVVFGSPVLSVGANNAGIPIPRQFRIIGPNPNPFRRTTLLRVEFLQPAKQLEVRLYDLLGRVLWARRFSPAVTGMLQFQLDFTKSPLSALPAGIYWLSVETAFQRRVKRLVYLR